MKRRLSTAILFLVITAGFMIRVWNLTSVPPGPYTDELRGFISAKSIIETGHDINGKLGFYFYNRLEFYPPVYGYLTYISSLFFNNTFAIRLPAVIAGTISIVEIYYLTFLFFKKRSAALTSAFVLAFIPWTVHFSRIGWEPALLIPVTLFAIILFKKFVDSGRTAYFYSSVIVFVICIYTNRASEFLSPVLLTTLTVVYWQSVRRNLSKLWWNIPIAIILTLPFAATSLTEPLMHERAASIFTFAGGVNKETVLIFLKNYLSHFSPQFLFLSGDSNTRHGAGTGVLYLALLPLILAGIVAIFKNISKQEFKFLLVWLLIFPLGGALTNDGVPHATRTLIGAPLFAILCGVGLDFLETSWPRLTKIIAVLLSIGFAVELATFLIFYFNYYPSICAEWCDYGQKEVLQYVSVNYKEYNRACLDNLNYWNEETLLDYYLPRPPIEIISGLDNPACMLPNSLLVTYKDSIPPQSSTPVAQIMDPEGHPLWLMYRSPNY